MTAATGIEDFALLVEDSTKRANQRTYTETVGPIDLPARLAAVEIQSGVAAGYDQLLIVEGR